MILSNPLVLHWPFMIANVPGSQNLFMYHETMISAGENRSLVLLL